MEVDHSKLKQRLFHLDVLIEKQTEKAPPLSCKVP